MITVWQTLNTYNDGDGDGDEDGEGGDDRDGQMILPARSPAIHLHCPGYWC